MRVVVYVLLLTGIGVNSCYALDTNVMTHSISSKSSVTSSQNKDIP